MQTNIKSIFSKSIDQSFLPSVIHSSGKIYQKVKTKKKKFCPSAVD